MSKWIRKGDRVLVISGNEKGKMGEVLARKEDRVLVQGLNLRKKHLKRTQESQAGRIVEMEAPMHVSNVALCTKDGEKIKLRVRASKNGKRELVYRAGEADVVYRSVRKPA
jgi:large subunit ribosomal protein L24